MSHSPTPLTEKSKTCALLADGIRIRAILEHPAVASNSFERSQRVETLVRQAVDRDPAQRAAFLADVCGNDQTLRAEVEALLAKSAQNGTMPGSTPARRIGHYELRGLLGVGGMGEVYRAYDLRLGREVAIKVLPPAFTGHPDRLARFEREARVLASVNHPNIAAIYGVEGISGEGGRVAALVLELVEGETLADRIARTGALPLGEALRSANQIVDALDAAHEKGIVHRDLKPANITVTPDGTLKVLDFGLARIEVDNPDSAETIANTTEGMFVGTPAYMSPEQARGQAADKRSDVWAFGCVLFEMLSGSPAFGGATLTDTVAAVIERSPDWLRLPGDTPAALQRLLRSTLEKDRRQRLRDIADARMFLQEAVDSDPAAQVAPRPATRLPWMIATAALLVAGVATWIAGRGVTTTSAADKSTLRRMTWNAGFSTEPALSPDGSLLVYAAAAPSEDNLDLWLQRVSGGTPVRLTQDAADDREPVVSPDGTLIAFRSERAGGGVFVMPTLGGDARLVAPQGRRPRFAPDGKSIIYWTGRWLGGTRSTGTAVYVVPANGGTPRLMSQGFANARNPVWAPDGRSVLFFGRKNGSQPLSQVGTDAEQDAQFDWWWVRVDGGEPAQTGVYRTLIDRGFTFIPAWELDSLPQTWDESGVLFSGGTTDVFNIWQLPLSPQTGRVSGPLVQLTSGAGTDVNPSRDRSGRIAFESTDSVESVFRLTLDVAAGKSLNRIESLADDWGFTAHRGSASRDGRWLAYPKHRPDHSELWLKDLATGTARHLTTTALSELNPAISADGTQVAYTVVENNRVTGYVMPATGGAPRRVCDDCRVSSWLSDARRVLALFPDSQPAVRIVDVTTQITTPVFSGAAVNRAFPTADDRWLVVGGADVAWIIPLAPGTSPATPQDALTIDFPMTDVATGRIAGWSADGRVLYSLLGLDGFRCLYAQRIDLEHRTVAGPPSVVHHFHDPARLWGSTPMSNAITDDGFFFDQLARSGGIWLRDQAPANRP